MNGKCWHCGSTAHDTSDHPGRYRGGAVDGPHPAAQLVTLSRAQALALSSLLGHYQNLLEGEIDCEQIATDEGKVDPQDPEIRARLQRSRRRNRKCEEFQKILSPGGPHEPLA